MVTAKLESYFENPNILATKDGVRSQNATISLVILPRPVYIQFTTSAPAAALGQTVLFIINLKDSVSNSYLDHPINLSLSIRPMGSDPTNKIAVYTFERVVQTAQYSWLIPGDVALGDYDIEVSVVSNYYNGTSILTGGLRVTAPVLIWPYIVGAIAAGALSTVLYVKVQTVRSKRSVKGLMILHTTGAPVDEHISPFFSKLDTVLISGAIAGMIGLIKEITGRGLRTIRIDGGYLELRRGASFWSVLLMQRKLAWIGRTIDHMMADIELNHGMELRECCHGEKIHIDIRGIITRYFGVELNGSHNDLSSIPRGERKSQEK